MKEIIKPRILFAPVEICENMQRLANGFRKLGFFATSINYKFNDPRKYMNDINLQIDRSKNKFPRVYKRLSFFLFALSNYDIFHFFYGKTLLPNYIDLPILKRLNKKVFMHFRGEDCLNYDIFNYWRAKARSEVYKRPPVNTPLQKHNINKLNKYCDEFFISTPSLKQALPRSILIPQVIEIDKIPFIGVNKKNDNDPIIIIHPTSSQWKFGTDFIIKSIKELKNKKYNVDFRIIEGVPYEKAKEIYKKADIGIDTMLQGWYGNISIEFMAMGKPVVCFIRNKWKNIKPELPVYDSHPKLLTKRLEDLINNFKLRKKLSLLGREYVEKHHNVEVMTRQLLKYYKHIK